MYLCPINQDILVPASAGGGRLWYSPSSRGRLVTLAMAKKFLGKTAALEIWVRAQTGGRNHLVHKKCPSCCRDMREVDLPQWIDRCSVDVCVPCHLIWFDEDEIHKVPHPEDLISRHGDGTLVQQSGESFKRELLAKEQRQNEKEALLSTEGPDQILKSIPAFFGLPVEISNPKPGRVAWISIILSLCLLILHFVTEKNAIGSLGFVPDDIWRNGGMTWITSAFMHAGWLHILSNLYFFWIFGDDVERYLGTWRFLAFFCMAAIIGNLFAFFFSGSPGVPHIGLSGVVMAELTFYGLAFPKSKIAYLFPLSKATSQGFIRPMLLWLKLPAILVVFAYLLKEFFYYFVYESAKFSAVAHSVHLGGIAAGIVAWFLFRDRLESKSLAVS